MLSSTSRIALRAQQQARGIAIAAARSSDSAPASAAAASASRPAPSASASHWGPASRQLPLESFSATPRVHLPPGGSRPVPLRYSRLPNDEPNSRRVQLDLFAATVVERWPKVMREEDEWKMQFHKHFEQIRQMKRQQHAVPQELQVNEQEAAAGEERAEGSSSSRVPVEVTDKSLLTQADLAHDLHATHRCLQDSLFLIVKRRGGGPKAGWQFPQGLVPFDILGYDPRVPDPTGKRKANKKEVVSLRSVAAESLAETIGSHAAIYFMGNAPMAVLREFKEEGEAAAAAARQQTQAENEARKADPLAPLPPLPTVAPPTIGQKTFFMHALFMDGEVRLTNNKEFEDFAWVKKEELRQYIGDKQADLLDKVLLAPKP